MNGNEIYFVKHQYSYDYCEQMLDYIAYSSTSCCVSNGYIEPVTGLPYLNLLWIFYEYGTYSYCTAFYFSDIWIRTQTQDLSVCCMDFWGWGFLSFF